uniref:Uncharacterized protein n=1 Tax=Castor canadensis TaxID=51338 RepID=A0A8C0X160_CASCN
MEEMARNVPGERFETNMPTQSHCQISFHPEEVRGLRHQEPRSPSSAEAPYCDLPRCPPPQDPLSAATSASQSVVGPELRQGPRGQAHRGQRHRPASSGM